MSQQLQNSGACSAPYGKLLPDELSDLLPVMAKLTTDIGLLRQGTKAMTGSLRQIAFFALNNGSIDHGKIVEIMKKNGVMDLACSTADT